MEIDFNTVKKIASLAKIDIASQDLSVYQNEMNNVLHWFESIDKVNTDNVEPQSSVHVVEITQHPDLVMDGNYKDDILKNSPKISINMFSVPKVIE